MSDSPFWFASDDLLTDLLRHEIHFLAGLLTEYSQLPKLLDLPAASAQQRTACFALLAHCALRDAVYETFAQRWEQSPSLGKEEEEVNAHTWNLFNEDAPEWVREIGKVADLLPSRIYDALPEALRRGGFNAHDPAQVQIIESAASKLSSVVEIQALCRKVLDEQLQRLEQRWLVAQPIHNPTVVIAPPNVPTKQKRQRKGDKQRLLRDELIAEIADISPTSTEYVKLMDERKVRPQPTWSGWPGSWSKAYKDSHLRKLIHQDKSRALGRVHGRQ